MGKMELCLTLDEEIVEQRERIREEAGVPISQQIEMRLDGYEIRKIGEGSV